jgi:VWFA-related protein
MLRLVSRTLLFFTLSAAFSSAQSPQPDMLAAFTVSKNVNEVNLVFSVLDSRGHLRSDLSEADFQLLDNHHPPEQIRYFQRQTELPLRVALLIDNSASITTRVKFEKKAVSVFLKKILRPMDQALIASFDDQVHLLHDFTNDANALEVALRRMQPQGSTSLYDAVVFAGNKLARTSDAKVSRRVIILISDGDDNHSRKLLNDAQQAALASDAVIFSLNTNDPTWGYTKGEAALELLSRASGGSILPAKAESELKRAFADVEKTLRTQYAIGYTPANFQADGSFHSVQVLTRQSHLTVQCRRGYFAAKY